MGKGIILDKSFQQYTVELILMRERVEAKIAALLAEAADVWAGIPAIPDPEDKVLAMLKYQSLALRANTLQKYLPANPVVYTYCLNYVDLSVGQTVGTIEVPGERVLVYIAPGGAYDADEDGQLAPAVDMTPEGFAHAMAMLPGWQKWRPTYRTGVIKSLDIEADRCAVTLDDAYSSAQDLDINAYKYLYNVPIEFSAFGQSGAEAFRVTDPVVVKFENQSWDEPKVIGWNRLS